MKPNISYKSNFCHMQLSQCDSFCPLDLRCKCRLFQKLNKKDSKFQNNIPCMRLHSYAYQNCLN